MSMTMPGRKSASPKMTRQLEMSPTAFLYSQALRILISRNASSITESFFRDIMRTVILERVLMKP